MQHATPRMLRLAANYIVLTSGIRAAEARKRHQSWYQSHWQPSAGGQHGSSRTAWQKGQASTHEGASVMLRVYVDNWSSARPAQPVPPSRETGGRQKREREWVDTGKQARTYKNKKVKK